MPTFDIEQRHTGLIAGTDEAGRGPWAGPVVAAAVCFPHQNISPDLRAIINDSKKLTAKQRERAFDLLMKSDAFIGVGQASAEEIDDVNILRASFLAMERALNQLEEKYQPVSFVLIDGNRLPAWHWPCEAIIKGDSLSFSIAAASIIAKVTRDRIMTELAKEYPAYAWDKNAGYGTAAHIEALQKYGPCPYHRKSYAPIKNCIKNLSAD